MRNLCVGTHTRQTSKFSKFWRSPIPLLLPFLLLCLTGCAEKFGIISSNHLQVEEDTVTSATAGHYFLPKALVRLVAERGTLKPDDPKPPVLDDSQCTLQLKETVFVPDSDYLFRLTHLKNWFSDDEIKVTTTKEGFLSAINLTSADKSGEFLIKLAELAKEVAKAAAGDTLPPSTPASQPPPFYFEFLIDPTKKGDLKRVNDNLNGEECSLRIINPTVVDTSVTKKDGKGISKPELGIFYRPPVQEKLIFKTMNGDSKYIEHTLFIPNRGPILNIDLTREPLVEVVHELKFTNGILTDIKAVKPSSALAAVNIPIEIAKQIVAIPSEILQLKIDLTNADKDLLEAQKGIVEEQKALLDVQEELRKLQENPSAGE